MCLFTIPLFHRHCQPQSEQLNLFPSLSADTRLSTEVCDPRKVLSAIREIASKNKSVFKCGHNSCLQPSRPLSRPTKQATKQATKYPLLRRRYFQNMSPACPGSEEKVSCPNTEVVCVSSAEFLPQLLCGA